MTTQCLPGLALACALFALSPQHADASSPERFNSIVLALSATSATLPGSLGSSNLRVTAELLANGTFAYEKESFADANLTYSNWKRDSGTYSGKITLNFNSFTTGLWRDDYTGASNGYTSGTFEIIEMDVPGRPVAEPITTSAKSGMVTRIRLRGTGRDIRRAGLKYKILGKPRTGSLSTKRLPVVRFKSKKGFSGKVKFRYIAIEGKSRSKPAEVIINVK